ncbi:hypothetical protein LTR27_009562 [Elasticomyces elasticus]|nr:hypothetical protein LTR27_009562 [Elasticomyces elasticus]
MKRKATRRRPPPLPRRHGYSNPNPAGLMDLPVEIRGMVYEYLLPAVKRDWWLGHPLEMHQPGENDEYWSGDQWLEDHANELDDYDDYGGYGDGWDSDSSVDVPEPEPEPMPKNTTAFMRTNLQIYHEACDYLYAHGRFGVEISSYGGTVSMLNKTIESREIRAGSAPYFGALAHVRRLDLLITTRDNGNDACAAQDLTSTLVDWLRIHHLSKMNVYLDVDGTGHEHDAGLHHMRYKLMHQTPQKTSSQHVAAFVAEPLRDLCLTRSSCPYVRVRFPGFRLGIFKHMPNTIRRDMRTTRSLTWYGAFSRYTTAFDQSFSLLKSMFVEWPYFTFQRMPEKIYDARIRCDEKGLRELHNRFVRNGLAMLHPSGWAQDRKWDFTYEARNDLTEQDYIIYGRSLARLAAALPRETSSAGTPGPKLIDIAYKAWRAKRKAGRRARMRQATERMDSEPKGFEFEGEFFEDERDFERDEYYRERGFECQGDQEYRGRRQHYFEDYYTCCDNEDDDLGSDAPNDGWRGLQWG